MNAISRSLSSAITWDFIVNEQGHMSRYGHLEQSYYKQYLPGGVSVPEVNPPKKIAPYVYQISKPRAEPSLAGLLTQP